MRHEIRDSNSLQFTMEEVVGGIPTGGSFPKIDIYSIEFDQWWDQVNAIWAAIPPAGSNAMIDMGVVNAALSGVYSFDAGGAYAAPGATVNNSGSQGYIVKMKDPANGFLEFTFIVISDLMVSSATVPAVVDANVVQWLGTAATASTAGIPNVNITEIDGQNVPVMIGTGVLDVNVTAWDDETTGVGTSSTHKLPLVDVVTVRDSSNAAIGLKDFGEVGYDIVSHKVEAVKVADLISDDGITETSFVDDAITSRVLADDAITSDVIADDAIDEGAIAIDSVTYEEISESAAREISDAVWSADIFKSIYNHGALGPVPSAAPLGTIGHAITIDHLKDGINYWSGIESTPAHKCSIEDPTGTKFYSHHLASSALSTDQVISYIDRTVTIVKNLDFDAMEYTASTQSYLGRISSVGLDGSGQYFEVALVDEDATAIPGGFVLGDVVIVKSETDSTMHEVAHEVWEESVFDHATPDTFGMFSRIMTGLAQFNHRITDSTYDDSGRLLACRLVVYPTPEDADNATNPLTSVIVTSTHDEKQNMSTFLAREEDAGA